MDNTSDVFCMDDYPELALLGWNRVVRDIEGGEAFALYEAYWRFVDVDRMLPSEKELLVRLTQEYGNGIMNV